jgi:tRNA(Ile)-lysidine synthase
MGPADLDYTALIPLLAPHEGAPRWRVAWSGGLDSTVLLHLLTVYRQQRPLAPPLLAIHVNHQLQADAADWAAHCSELARSLGVPLRQPTVSVSSSGAGLEADARHARYAALEAGMAPGEVVLFAHHRDDQAETVMLRLLRGSGLAGLQGMPRQRAMGRGTLVRPLLPWGRTALEAYARRHRLTWVEDPSNSDLRQDRNFLRQQVMPLLASRWPDSVASLVRAAGHLEDADRALESLLPPLPLWINRFGDVGLSLDTLLAAEDAVASLQLRRWLRDRGLLVPESRPLKEFLRQLRGDGNRVRLCGGAWVLERFAGAVFLLPATLPECGPPATLVPGTRVALPAGSLALEPAAEGPALRLEAGEVLRLHWRRGGERLLLPGRAGHRRLKTLLQDAGVPPWWRQRLPLLYLGDELLAVGDLWLSQSSRYCARGGEGCWRPRWTPALATPKEPLSPHAD